MVQTVTVKGYGNVDFPDGMSRSDIKVAIQNNMQKLQNAGSQSSVPEQSQPSQPTLPGMNFIAPILSGYADWKASPKQAVTNRLQAVMQGGRELGQGIKQLGLEAGEKLGLVTPGTAQNYTTQTDVQRDLYNKTPAGQNLFANEIKSGVGMSPLLAIAPVFGSEAGLLSKMAQSGAGLGAIESTKYVPEGGSRLANTGKGILMGAGLPLIEPALNLGVRGLNALDTPIGDVMTALHPRNLLPSNAMARFATSPLSTEELQRNLEVTRGTQTGLGQVIGSPTAQRLQENVITKIPFAGGNAPLKQTGNEILGRGNHILEDYRNGVPHEDVTNRLGEALTNAAQRQKTLKNNLYSESNDIAEKVGLNLKLPRFTALVNQHIDALESTNMLQFEPETRSLINRLRNYRNPEKITNKQGAIVDQSGNPIIDTTTVTPPSLREANILAGKFNELSNKYASSSIASERHAASVFGQIGRALKTDIKSSIYNSGSRELINSFRQAERNYAKNYSEFLDKDITKYTIKDTPPETLLTTFLKTSNTADRSGLLEKLMSKLTPEEQKLVRYAYFSRSLEGAEDMRVVNPNKLSTLWRKLGSNQKKILVPDIAQRRRLDNYEKLVSMNPQAVNLMWNPATGQKNLDVITAVMALHPIKSFPEMIAGRVGNKLLTSESAREKIVKGIIDRRNGANP